MKMTKIIETKTIEPGTCDEHDTRVAEHEVAE